jgi:hypothetical protein
MFHKLQQIADTISSRILLFNFIADHSNPMLQNTQITTSSFLVQLRCTVEELRRLNRGKGTHNYILPILLAQHRPLQIRQEVET